MSSKMFLEILLFGIFFRQFTATALAFVLTLLNAGIDLISFSEILFSIYPPLFIALIIYSVGGTYLSILIGKVKYSETID